MLIPTANVIIGFDQDVIKQLFALKGNSYETVANSIPSIDKAKTTFIVNNGTGSSLISLKHQLGFNTTDQFLTVEFVDPTNDFEKRLLASRELPSFLMRELTDLVEVGVIKPTIKTDLELGISTVVPKILDLVDVKALNTIYKEFLDTNKNYLDPFVYIAYGVGNNLKTWHGPSKWRIMKLEVDITSEGSRKIKVGLTPPDVGLTTAYRTDVFNRPFNSLSIWTEAVDAYSPEITFSPATLSASASLGNIGVLLPDNYHRLVTECIRDYIRKFTRNKNVIVLLPDLSVALRKLLDNIKSDNAVYINAEFMTTNYVEFVTPQEISKNARDFEILRALAETLGFTLASDRPTSEYDNKKTSEKYPMAGPSIQALRDREAKDIYSITTDFLKTKFKFNLYSSTTDKEFYLDSKIIDEVFNKIRRYCVDTYSFKPVIHYENSLKIIDVWKKYGDHPLFSGSLGELDDKEGCVVVVGDAALIRNFLYGEFDISLLTAGSTTDAVTRFNEVYGVSFPLEALDRELLISKEYNKDIGEVTLLSGDEENGFGAISNLTDEFDFQQTDGFTLSEFKENVKKRGIPVFRFNTQEPNVLGIRSFDSVGYNTAMLTGTAKSAAYSLHKSVNSLIPENSKAFGDATLGALIANLKQTWAQQGLENIAGNKQAIINSLMEEEGVLMWENKDAESVKRYAEMVYLLFILQLQSEEGNPTSKLIIDQFTNNNAPSVYASFIEDVHTKSRIIGITTLPFFHLSNIYSITSQTCILYAQDPTITQTLPKPTEAINKFYSGVYKIMGFEHSITGSKAESSFNLARVGAFNYVAGKVKSDINYEFKDEEE